MPQPLRYRKGDLDDDPSSALPSRPHLAVKIAMVTNAWAYLEHQLSLVFVMLLGGETQAGLDIYNELIDRRLRESAFLAVARRKLPPRMVAQFRVFFGHVQKVAPARHAVAHGHWATLSTRPNSLLLCNDHVLSQEVRLFFEKIASDPNAETGPEARTFEGINKTFMEYKEKDFDDIIARIYDLLDELRPLLRKILLRSSWRAVEPRVRSARLRLRDTP